MSTVSRDDLIDYHYKLQLELKDLEEEIKRVERSNEILMAQNEKYRKLVQHEPKKVVKNVTKKPTKNLNEPIFSLSNVIDTSFIYEKLNKASDIYDFATGELMKHAKTVADGVTSSLLLTRKDSLNIKTLNAFDVPFDAKWNKRDGDDDKETTNLSSNESNDEDALKYISSEDEIKTVVPPPCELYEQKVN